MLSGFALASINAALNSLAFVLMTMGYLAIKRGERERHRKLMLGAFASSCLFLVSYLTRIALYGDTRFQGVGPMRMAYFAILISHVLLAIAVAPMVIVTLNHGLKDRIEKHRAIAKRTFPIWAYVSVTGVIVYALLYHY
jgi:putative membrane protein